MLSIIEEVVEKFRPGLEFEIRFGVLDEKRRLQVQIDQPLFDQLHLQFCELKSVQTETEHVTLYSWQNRSYRLLKGDEFQQKVQVCRPLDQTFGKHYCMRFAVSEEREETAAVMLEVCRNCIPTQRVRQRWIYWLRDYDQSNAPFWYMLTVINESIFEFEIEMNLSDLSVMERTVPMICRWVEDALKPIEALFLSYTNVTNNTSATNVSRQLRQEIVDKLNCKFRHPVNFPNVVISPHLEFTLPEWGDYTVTNKLNGEHVWIVMDEQQHAFAMTDKTSKLLWSVNTDDTDDTKNYTLMEAECFDNRYYLFDIFMNQGADVMDKPHADRVSMLQDCLTRHKWLDSVANLKQFREIRQTIELLRTVDPSYNDGLIFTPKGSAKHLHESIFKWKFPEQMTIDVKLERRKDHLFEPMVCSYGDQLIPWRGSLLFPLKDEILIDARHYTNPLNHGDIVEVSFDFARKRYVLGKHRCDKVKPNFKGVAENVWNDMRVPVTVELLEQTLGMRAREPTRTKQFFLDKEANKFLMLPATGFTDLHIEWGTVIPNQQRGPPMFEAGVSKEFLATRTSRMTAQKQTAHVDLTKYVTKNREEYWRYEMVSPVQRVRWVHLYRFCHYQSFEKFAIAIYFVSNCAAPSSIETMTVLDRVSMQSSFYDFDTHTIACSRGANSDSANRQFMSVKFPRWNVSTIRTMIHDVMVKLEAPDFDDCIIPLTETKFIQTTMSKWFAHFPQVETLQTETTSFDLGKLVPMPSEQPLVKLWACDQGLYLCGWGSDIIVKLSEVPSKQTWMALARMPTPMYTDVTVVYMLKLSNDRSTTHIVEEVNNSEYLILYKSILKWVDASEPADQYLLMTPHKTLKNLWLLTAAQKQQYDTYVAGCLSQEYLRLHNQVKRSLIATYCGRQTVLDLGIGQGGDLPKYRDAVVTQIWGVDVSVTNLDELSRRLHTSYQKMIPHVVVERTGAEHPNLIEMVRQTSFEVYVSVDKCDLSQKIHWFPTSLHPVRTELLQINEVGAWSMTRRADGNSLVAEILPLLGDSVGNMRLTDGTANMGGDTINFAKYFGHINSVEIDVKNFELLSNNVKAYGFSNIRLIHGDFWQVWPELASETDVLYLDVPWGKDYKMHSTVQMCLGDRVMKTELNGLMHSSVKYVILKVPNNADLLSTISGTYDYQVINIRDAFKVIVIRNPQQAPHALWKQSSVVTSFFSMSFFFKEFDDHSKTYPMMHQFLQNVKRCLKEGGHFIGTTIDGERLRTLLLKSNGEFRFKQRGFYRQLSQNQVLVSLPDTIVGDSQEESFVDFEYVTTELQKAGYRLIESQMFDDIGVELDEEERQLNQLYRRFVFKAPYVMILRINVSADDEVEMCVKDVTNGGELKWRGTEEYPIDIPTFHHLKQSGVYKVMYTDTRFSMYPIFEIMNEEKDTNMYSVEYMKLKWNKINKN